MLRLDALFAFKLQHWFVYETDDALYDYINIQIEYSNLLITQNIRIIYGNLKIAIKF